VGTKKLTRQVQALPAEVLFASNLADPQYVNLVLNGSLANLPSTIAKYWSLAQPVRKHRRTATADQALPIKKKQIRHPKLLDNLMKVIEAIVRRTCAA
jgi:hypothetical protein